MEVSLFHIVGLAEEALLAVDGLRQIGESVDAESPYCTVLRRPCRAAQTPVLTCLAPKSLRE